METILIFLVVATILVFGAFEIYLIMTGKPTISSMIRTAYKNYPPLGFLTGLIVGLMLGHFFWL